MSWLKNLLARFHKSKVPDPSPYSTAYPYLAQGDIFEISLVAPLADDEIRILRTETGQHGSRVFSGDPGCVFGYADLIDTIAALPADEQVGPFQNRGGIPLEYVVVPGDLMDYFVVASQTCDVSGVGSTPKPFAAILPVTPLAAFLSRERLPIELGQEEMTDETKWTTIVDYLATRLGEDLYAIRDDAFGLPDRIRQLLRKWKPTKNNEKQVRGKIVNSIKDVVSPRKNYIYYLPLNSEQRVPESFVDFTRLFSAVTDKLQHLIDRRVCTLATPYREEFASKLGNYLSRIATPAPLVPPDL
jgi:hypothetical protein